jgi:hypothetical protein
MLSTKAVSSAQSRAFMVPARHVNGNLGNCISQVRTACVVGRPPKAFGASGESETPDWNADKLGLWYYP